MNIEQPPGYQLNFVKNLGSGTFGSVYQAIQTATEAQVAVKIIQLKKMKGQYLKNALAQEIQITQNLRGPNVIRFIDFIAGQNHAFIVLELCQLSLDEKLPTLYWSQSQRETQSILMLSQIVNGYRTLILKNILHRDLKPANILLKNNIIKISDFGFAKRILDPLTLNKTCVGTPYYQSLQLLGAQYYTSKSDVWALGIIFYELLHGHRPWTAQTRQQLQNNIKIKPLVLDQKLQDNTKDFLRRSLSLYEKDRMSWIEVFNHPIFQGFFNMQMQNSTFQLQLREALKQKVTKYELQSLKQTLFAQKQILFQSFYELLQTINTKISLNLGIYAFNRADILTNGIITKEQLKIFLDKFVTYKFSELHPRVMQYFDLFSKVLTTTKLSLKYVFDFYKQKKDGNLKKQGFARLIKHLDQTKTISEEDIQYAFKLIDFDNSGTIEYHQIQKFFRSK